MKEIIITIPSDVPSHKVEELFAAICAQCEEDSEEGYSWSPSGKIVQCSIR